MRHYFKSFLIAAAAVLIGHEEIIDCAQSAILGRTSDVAAGVTKTNEVKVMGGTLDAARSGNIDVPPLSLGIDFCFWAWLLSSG